MNRWLALALVGLVLLVVAERLSRWRHVAYRAGDGC